MMNDVVSWFNAVLAVSSQLVTLINNNWVLQGGLVIFVFVLAFKLVQKYLLR